MNPPPLQERAFSTPDQAQATPSIEPLHVAPVAAKSVVLDFDGGLLCSDVGLLLLKDIDGSC